MGRSSIYSRCLEGVKWTLTFQQTLLINHGEKWILKLPPQRQTSLKGNPQLEGLKQPYNGEIEAVTGGQQTGQGTRFLDQRHPYTLRERQPIPGDQ